MAGSEDRNARQAYVSELRAQEQQLLAKLDKVRRLIAIIEDADPLDGEPPRAGVLPQSSAPVRHSFENLTYRHAIYIALRERPMTTPEIADFLTSGGIDPDRKRVKMNVDSMMKRLRSSGVAAKGLDGRWVLREVPGGLIARLLP